jgi:hypothetical protein
VLERLKEQETALAVEHLVVDRRRATAPTRRRARRVSAWSRSIRATSTTRDARRGDRADERARRRPAGAGRAASRPALARPAFAAAARGRGRGRGVQPAGADPGREPILDARLAGWIAGRDEPRARAARARPAVEALTPFERLELAASTT